MFILNSTEDNLVAVLYKLLRLNKYRIAHSELKERLKTHPDYPTLYSVKDLLEDLNVNFSFSKIQSSEIGVIDKPFMAHMENKGGQVILVHKICGKSVEYSDNLGRVKKETLHSFKQHFTGRILQISRNLTKETNSSTSELRNEVIIRLLLPIILFTIIVIIILGVIQYTTIAHENLDWRVLVFFITTKALGLIISSFLYFQQITNSYGIARNVCNGTNKSDCKAVSESKYANIFGPLTWADAGITYFLSSILSFFIIGFPQVFPVIEITSIIGLFFVFYSIYTQFILIKRVCPLCLLVASVVLIELIGVFLFSINPIYRFNVFVIYLLITIVSLLIVYLYKSYTQLFIKIISLDIVHKTLKLNPKVFKAINDGPKIEVELNQIPTIKIGAETAKCKIIFFISLDCPHCSDIIAKIENFVNPDISFQVVIAPPKDLQALNFYGTLFLEQSKSQKQLHQLLRDWFIKDHQRHSIDNETSSSYRERLPIKKINKVFIDLDITETPTIYMNSIRLKNIYSIDDVVFLTNKNLL